MKHAAGNTLISLPQRERIERTKLRILCGNYSVRHAFTLLLCAYADIDLDDRPRVIAVEPAWSPYP